MAYEGGMMIDVVVGLILLSSALISFMRGLIREVLTIAGVAGGIAAAIAIGPAFAPTVRDWFGIVEGEDAGKLFDIIPKEYAADATAYGIIFILVVIILSVASHFLSGAARAVGLGPVDRTLGVFFGIGRGLLLLGLLYLPFHLNMDQAKKDEYFSGSHTFYIVEKISAVMAQYVPDTGEVKKSIDEGADDLIKKKLEEQNLLGGEKAALPADGPRQDQTPVPAPGTSGGYNDQEREKLDKLFSEPTVNE